MMNDTRIETLNLRLRAWRDGDVALYAELCKLRPGMRSLEGLPTHSEVEAAVRYFVDSDARDGITFWVVERRADGTFLGLCGLVRIADRDCPLVGKLEIGWRFGDTHWRSGYGYEAACGVLSFAFSPPRSETIYSRTAAGNTASRKLMEKLGLKRCAEADYVPVGESDKLLVYSISRRDWDTLSDTDHAMRSPTKISNHSVVDTLTDGGGAITTFEWMTDEEAESWEQEIAFEEKFFGGTNERPT